MNPILVTGCAGFIGMHCTERLLERGETVVGIDNLNAYYDVALKQARLERLLKHPKFRFERLDVANRSGMAELFSRIAPQRVLHLAAQAGVRYSLEQPDDYTDSNLVGFANVLQGCRNSKVKHLVFASSSSVYGGNTKTPFSEHDAVDHPISYYAATKKANEMMAHSYAHLYRIPITGLRFFTVYGPWGRPDMALFRFTQAMLAGQRIDVYGHGQLIRDFTYIDDIVAGVIGVLDKPAESNATFDQAVPDSGSSTAPYRIFNIGNHSPVLLLDFISALESALGTVAHKRMLPIQPGDMHTTSADTTSLTSWIGLSPSTPISTGVKQFIEWYRNFYTIK